MVSSKLMRNNLVFGNFPEAMNEKHSVTEKGPKFYCLWNGNTTSIVDKLCVERIDLHIHLRAYDELLLRWHKRWQTLTLRLTSHTTQYFCQITPFMDRETVRISSRKLNGTCYYISEHFSKWALKTLIPRHKETIHSGQKALLSYGTFYIDGIPQTHYTHVHRTALETTIQTWVIFWSLDMVLLQLLMVEMTKVVEATDVAAVIIVAAEVVVAKVNRVLRGWIFESFHGTSMAWVEAH